MPYHGRVNETLDPRTVRRLALVKAGLLKPEWTGLPRTAGRGNRRHRAAAHAVIRRFGYLQLDTVSIAGARSHSIVLQSRLPGLPPDLGESLLQPGEPLFEYWGHQASWIPLEHYPLFAFRRKGMRETRWWKGMMDGRKTLARDILRRIRDEGPLRSADLEGKNAGTWWDHKPAKRVVVALWSSGDLAVRERASFQRTFDLPERVIPEELLNKRVSRSEGIRELLALALEGHGWATSGTLATTWSFQSTKMDARRFLGELEEAGRAIPAGLRTPEGKAVRGWIAPGDLALAGRLGSLRPRKDRGVLLSPFDPVLWDRKRVRQLFGFDQVLEIFKPAPQRVYGYYCLPVLAGEELTARVDLKADRARGKLRVLSRRFESTGGSRPGNSRDKEVLRSALERYAKDVGLSL